MSRIYKVSTADVATAAERDLIELIAAAEDALKIYRWTLGQSTDFGDTNEEILLVRVYRAEGAYTSGSGGTTPTPEPRATADTAASASAEMNNTTVAVVGAGALNLVESYNWNTRVPLDIVYQPEERLEISPTDAFIIRIEAPSGSIDVTTTVVFEEIGG